MSARPSSVRRSSTTERLPRLSRSNDGLTMSPRAPPVTWSMRRNGSPPGASTLMTSAPQSASTPPAAGPATHTPSSTTRPPSSMRLVLAQPLLVVGRSVDGDRAGVAVDGDGGAVGDAAGGVGDGDDAGDAQLAAHDDGVAQRRAHVDDD